MTVLKHKPLLSDELLSRLDLFVELLDLFVMAETLLVIRIQLQALAHLAADHRRGGVITFLIANISVVS